MSMGRLIGRAVVRVAPADPGEDAAGFLQGLLTNDVAGPTPVYAALLSAQGKTLFDLIVWRDGDAMLLDCEADRAEELARRLALYRLRRKIAIAPDPLLGVFWSDCPAAGFVPDPRLAALGHRRIAAISGDDQAVDAEWLAHRLALGVAEGHAETGDILWLETNAAELAGVSFSKGCYIGQENTARMNWRQKINRRLIVVPLATSRDDRRRAAYPQLGLAVDHLRVDDIADAFLPPWMQLRAGE